MKHEVNLGWLEKMAFESELDGHKITLDAAEEVGGTDQGPRPKKLMLLALAGCTAMDVVSLLKKMRIVVDDLNIKVDSEMTEDHPKQYTSMHVTYEFWGSDLPMAKLEKIVKLSQENYCGVSALYKKAIPVTSSIKTYPPKQ